MLDLSKDVPVPRVLRLLPVTGLLEAPDYERPGYGPPDRRKRAGFRFNFLSFPWFSHGFPWFLSGISIISMHFDGFRLGLEGFGFVLRCLRRDDAPLRLNLITFYFQVADHPQQPDSAAELQTP